jgi:FAD/FMN-containing dehydrogenase/Fe-S oxidoreductase
MNCRMPPPDHEAEVEAYARALRRQISGEVRRSQHDRMLYATDASMYQVTPLAVVIPRSVDELIVAVETAAQFNLPLLPRAGGTSLAGQAVNRAVVIDVSAHCTALRQVDPAARSAVVEPGLVLDTFNTALQPHGLMFGPDVATASHACLGGMIGNNSAGAHSVLYGRTVEHINAMRIMLADGHRCTLRNGAADADAHVHAITQQLADVVLPIRDEIRRRYPNTMRRVNGYNLDLLLDQLEASRPGTFDQVNLASLICGSEGTLAVMLDADVNLVERPAHTGLAVIGFSSTASALQAVNALLETGPAAVELIDDMVLSLAERNIKYRSDVDRLRLDDGSRPNAVLYVEYFADSVEAVHEKLHALQPQWGRQHKQVFTDAASMTSAWALRKAGEPLLHGLPGLRKPITFIEDTAVDPARLVGFIERFRAILSAHGTQAAYYAHASVGCLHIRPLVNLKDATDCEMMRRITADVTDLVLEFGGALSGEHGDGRVRSPFLEQFYGPVICEAFRAVKRIFDPDNRLNPGNIVAPLPMDRHLRVRPDTRVADVPVVDTYFQYAHGFAEAVEQCNGAGLCRRMTGGTMCPSFRATRDERHATRGRGNALRLAITGQFSEDGQSPRWDDPGTIATLDLCLSCKACKSECPSNVDVSRLKAEYTAQRYRETGRIPLHNRMIGHVRQLNHLGSALRPLSNAMTDLPGISSLIRHVMRMDKRRTLPRFERSLHRWFNAHHSPVPQNAPAVVMYPDCFTVYNEPHVGRAAIRVLEAMGYRVLLPRLGCCGRSLLSVGMLDQAVSVIAASVRNLKALMERENPIAVVGCEPSCISAIVDDWPDLKLDLDVSTVQDIADRTMIIESFVATYSNALKHSQHDASPVLVHGHCHQKALWGMDHTLAALEAVGSSPHPIDAGCCGMAGAFGYDRDRYELSMQIGELALFPALRAHDEAVVVAPGTSCRQQIHDGTGRTALHPIELIAERLLGAPA